MFLSTSHSPSSFLGHFQDANNFSNFQSKSKSSGKLKLHKKFSHQEYFVHSSLAADVSVDASSSPLKTERKRVVVLGGSGRIGASSVSSLLNFSLNGNQSSSQLALDVVIAARDRTRAEEVCSRFDGNATFVQCDIDDDTALRKTLDGADLVIHTAGPFQRKERCAVLEAAIAVKTPYMDVCDDRDYSQSARALHDKARAAGVPALTTTGIYPGVSNLMAAELVRLARDENSGSEESSASEPKSLKFSYYTAGSGGAGPTILATSFLLLGEEALAFKDGEELSLRPYSACRFVDFGKGIGEKPVYLLNLPEVTSCHSVLNIPTVSARFGTDPPIWNWAMEAMVALVPKEILKDRSKVQAIVKISDPAVRFVDKWAGEKMAMRVDLECTDGRKASALYSHELLSICVGQAVAAFALAMLEGSTQPGVWFPEEEEGIAIEHRQRLLDRSSLGTITYIMNRAPWRFEKPAKQIGFGLYF